MDAARGRLIAVQEDHSGEGEAVNTVAAVGECHRWSLGKHQWSIQPCVLINPPYLGHQPDETSNMTSIYKPYVSPSLCA